MHAKADYTTGVSKGGWLRLFLVLLVLLVAWYYIKFESIFVAILPAFVLLAVGAAFVFFKSWHIQAGYLTGITFVVIAVALSMLGARNPDSISKEANNRSSVPVIFVAPAKRDPRVAGLLERLGNSDSNVRLISLELLAEIASPSDIEAARRIEPLLMDRSHDIRLAALMLFISKMSPTSGAVPALVSMLEDPDERIRARAAQALGRIEPGPSQAVSVLQARLQDPSSWVRICAAHALASIGTLRSAGAALPLLAAELTDSQADKFRRRQAAISLGKLGPLAEDAIPSLTTALKDPESIVRFAAFDALRAINSPQSRQAQHDFQG